ncbi:MAG: DNA-processing protein DprA [Truepera sp.]|nr:DNA-processing protein DprA [Truepera sp.]
MIASTQPTESFVGELNEIERKHAPRQLFVAGDSNLLRLRPRISVIGSRSPSPEGLKAARAIAQAIVKHGGVVVSGLAKGIDTAAHLAAISAGGKTIAVIGTGLDITYPKGNAGLQKRLMDKHLVVTQFPEGTPPKPRNFPMRNRTMALLSEGSIIVEAGAESGTRHQGWEAIRLGRSLFLPKCLIEAEFSWPREMQEYGAIAFQPPEIVDWLDELFPVGMDPREYWQGLSELPFKA